jgi:mycothiol synthase
MDQPLSPLKPAYTVRPPTMNDLGPVAALINDCSQAEIGSGNTSEAIVGSWWTAKNFDLETDAWLVTAPDGRLAAYAGFFEEAPPGPSEVDAYVQPDFSGQGIGSYFLRCFERRAQHTLTHSPAGVWIGLSQHVWSTNEAACRLLEQHGFRHVRSWQRMLIELKAPPPPPQLPDGVSIRTLALGQEERAVYEAVEEAMADEWGHPQISFEEWLTHKIEREDNFDPTLWFLVTAGQEIVGAAICRWERPGQPEQGHIRDLGVRRPWRRRGIALAVLQHAFGEFYRRGKRQVGLAVDATSLTGAERLYHKAGMRTVQVSLIYEKEIRPGLRNVQGEGA